MYTPEPSLIPPEPDIDGGWICKMCEEVIPGDEWAYTVNGDHYCMDCMDSMRECAPYRDEVI